MYDKYFGLFHNYFPSPLSGVVSMQTRKAPALVFVYSVCLLELEIPHTEEHLHTSPGTIRGGDYHHLTLSSCYLYTAENVNYCTKVCCNMKQVKGERECKHTIKLMSSVFKN